MHFRKNLRPLYLESPVPLNDLRNDFAAHQSIELLQSCHQMFAVDDIRLKSHSEPINFVFCDHTKQFSPAHWTARTGASVTACVGFEAIETEDVPTWKLDRKFCKSSWGVGGTEGKCGRK